MGGCGARSTFADLVTEAEGLGDGEDGEDSEEWGAFFEGFRDDAATATGDDGVNAAKNVGWGVMLASTKNESSVSSRAISGLKQKTYLKLVSRNCTWREVNEGSSQESPAG